MVVKAEGQTHRQRQAIATKAQIASAARRLFTAQGYTATTIAAIAAAADIPVQTIYSAFGNKAAILRSIAWGVAGTLDIDRAHDAALAQPDPRDGLQMAANIQRRQFEQMYDVIDLYQQAARTDPDIVRDLETIADNRERAFRRHLEAIADHLAPQIDIDDGVAIYLALVLPEIYRTLVIERGWSTDRYESWLANALATQLLPGQQHSSNSRVAHPPNYQPAD